MNDTEFDGRRIRVDKASDRRQGGGGMSHCLPRACKLSIVLTLLGGGFGGGGGYGGGGGGYGGGGGNYGGGY